MSFLVFVLIVSAAAVLLPLGALSASFALAKLCLFALGLLSVCLILWLILNRRRRP